MTTNKKKSTKSKTAVADTAVTAAKTPVAAPVAAKTVSTPPVAAPVAAKTVSTPPVAAPVVAKTVSTPPVAAPVAAKPVTAVAPVVAAAAPAAAKAAPVAADAAVVRTPGNGHAPVAVMLKKATAEKMVAVIRYQGPLAQKADKVVAVLGTEFFGCRRWEATQDVEMKRVKDGAFEAEVSLVGKDNADRALMALQLAFTTPTRAAWDSAGVPYGYYQVSTLTGAVESVPN